MSEPILLETTPITPEVMVTASHISRPDNPRSLPVPIKEPPKPVPIPSPEDPKPVPSPKDPKPVPSPDQDSKPVPEDSDLPPEIVALRERKEEMGRLARELCKDHYEEEFLNIFDGLEKRTDILRKV